MPHDAIMATAMLDRPRGDCASDLAGPFFYITSETVASAPGSLLYGYAVTDDDVIFGQGGLDLWRRANPHKTFRPLSGRYAAVLRDGDVTTIASDPCGQELIYLFRDDAFWAASNSLQLLAQRLRETRRIVWRDGVSDAYFLQKGNHVGQQPIGLGTVFRNIALLPATSRLVHDHVTGRAVVEHGSVLETFRCGKEDYHERLARFAGRAAGLVRALCGNFPFLNLNLSGGYDSRVVLGLAKAAGAEPGHLKIMTDVRRTQDYVIARSLCAILGFAPNQADPPVTKDHFRHVNTLGAWEASCLGGYLPLYETRRAAPPRDAGVRLTGDLTTDWKFFAGNGLFNVGPVKFVENLLIATRNKDHGRILQDEFTGLMNTIGMDMDHPAAMEIYYSQVRSRHHCGRHSYKMMASSHLVTPLVDPDLIAIEILAAEQGWDRRKVFCDLLALLHPILAIHPFDREEKCYPDEMIASSMRQARAVEVRDFSLWKADDDTATTASLTLPFDPARPNPIRDGIRESIARCEDEALGFTADYIRAARDELLRDDLGSHQLRAAAHIHQVARLRALFG
ncbi:MAG: hypothetical protein ACK4WC_09145 [Rubrimonas sp.]